MIRVDFVPATSFGRQLTPLFIGHKIKGSVFIVQELCESRGGRPGLSVLTSLLFSVDVKQF